MSKAILFDLKARSAMRLTTEAMIAEHPKGRREAAGGADESMAAMGM